MARFTAIASSIVFGFIMSSAALADDGAATTPTAAAASSSSTGYATQATDRGGRPAPSGDVDVGQASLLDWLRALMD